MFASDLLKDKVVVVTGGGTGLGKSMSARFLALGAKLVIASRGEGHLEEAAAELGKSGGEVLPVQCDVRDPASVDAMVRKAVERFGHIDCLVNNAAGNFLCPTEDLTYNGFNTVVQIVLYGTFNCTQAVGKQMIAQGTGGSILSIITPYAWTGSAYVVPSAVAKAGVLTMMRSLAVEWARYGIRANAIAPGPFPTEGAFSRLMPAGMDDTLITKEIPAGRFGRHDELANLASFLLADGSGYITGDCVTIDGGRWLMGGEFNGFTRFDPAAVKQMMSAMKPAKK